MFVVVFFFNQLFLMTHSSLLILFFTSFRMATSIVRSRSNLEAIPLHGCQLGWEPQ